MCLLLGGAGSRCVKKKSWPNQVGPLCWARLSGHCRMWDVSCLRCSMGKGPLACSKFRVFVWSFFVVGYEISGLYTSVLQNTIGAIISPTSHHARQKLCIH